MRRTKPLISVSNVSEGLTPSNHVQALKPSGSFAVIEKGEYLFIDPKSYARYNALGDAVSGIDPAGAARLYTSLKPRLEEAYDELGYPDVSFDRAVERAVVQLLSVPVPSDSLRDRMRAAIEIFLAGAATDAAGSRRHPLPDLTPARAWSFEP